MERLEFPITKKGFRYDLIERHGQWALIEQVNLEYPEAPRRFEVWRIRIRKATQMYGKDYPEREVAPSDVEWGNYGWTFLELRDATKFFNEKSHRNNNNSRTLEL